MKRLLGFASLIVLLQSLQPADAKYIDRQSPELVIKITRHGARTPTVYPPGDPNNEFWKDPLGALTNVGKLQLYEIGKSFRSFYRGFLNESYKPEEILILSTDVDRTIMSCESFLAGLYPPKDDQVWNPKINWQPIPVHLLNQDAADTQTQAGILLFQHCQDGTENDVFFSEHKDTIELIQSATGIPYKKCLDRNVFAVLDALTTEKFYGRTLPFGLDPHYDEIKYLKDAFTIGWFGTPLTASTYNGGLYENLISMLQKKVANAITQKAISICMHDVNVLSFLVSLTENYPLTSPEFAASIVLELIKRTDTDQESFKVKVFIIPAPGAPRQILQIKGCGQRCSLEDFIEQLRIASIPQTSSVCICSQN